LKADVGREELALVVTQVRHPRIHPSPKGALILANLWFGHVAQPQPNEDLRRVFLRVRGPTDFNSDGRQSFTLNVLREQHQESVKDRHAPREKGEGRGVEKHFWPGVRGLCGFVRGNGWQRHFFISTSASTSCVLTASIVAETWRFRKEDLAAEME
jgi:hypothetical protein